MKARASGNTFSGSDDGIDSNWSLFMTCACVCERLCVSVCMTAIFGQLDPMLVLK